jgi:DNA-binding transcriptional LysR family regulator
LGVEHATVARRISELERCLATKLVDRRGGRYSLTGAGHRVADHARRMREEVFAIERVGLADVGSTVTELTATMPPTIASELVVPRLPAFIEARPWLRLRLIGASQTLSLTRREADIALRLSRPEGSSLIARRLGELGYGLFATTAYLAGRPEDEFCFIGLEDDFVGAAQQVWLDAIAGSRATLFRSNDLLMQCAAVKAGMGIAALPLFLGAAQGLRHLRPDLTIRRPIWVTYHRDLKSSPAVAAAVEFLASCLPKRPSASGGEVS